jgi:hypothetical protein
VDAENQGGEQGQKQEEQSASELFATINALNRENRQLKLQNKRLSGTESAESLKQKAAEDPIGFMQSFGIDLGRAIEAYASGGDASQQGGGGAGQDRQQSQENAQKQAELMNEIKSLKQQVDDLVGSSRRTQYESELKRLDEVISEGGEKYKFSKALGREAAEFAIRVAAGVYEDTEQLPDMLSVLDAVESHYEKKYSVLGKLFVPQEQVAQGQTQPAKAPAPNIDATPTDTQAPDGDISFDEMLQAAVRDLK